MSLYNVGDVTVPYDVTTNTMSHNNLTHVTATLTSAPTPALSRALSPGSATVLTSGALAPDYTNDSFLLDDVSPTECTNEYCVSDEVYVDMLIGYIFPSPFEWVLILLYVLVCITGVTGNFLVCFVVWREKSMRTVTNMFIVNLAVGDLLVCLICLPPTVLDDVTETWYMGQVMCKIVKYVQGVSVCVAVLTLTSISVERFYAICRPLMFKATQLRAQGMICLIWLVSLCIMIPELVVLDIQSLHSATILLTSCRASEYPYFSQAVYQLFLSLAMYVVPLILMAATYGMITRTLWSQNNIPSESSQDRLRPSDFNLGRENVLQTRRKVAKMLIAVVVMFSVCYLPVHLLNILRYSGVLQGFTLAKEFALVSHFMCYVNSATNPLIYYFMSAKFRMEFRKACTCCCCCMQRSAPARYTHASAAYSTYRYTNAITNTAGGRGYCDTGAGARGRGAVRGGRGGRGRGGGIHDAHNHYDSPTSHGKSASYLHTQRQQQQAAQRDRPPPYTFKSNITNTNC